MIELIKEKQHNSFMFKMNILSIDLDYLTHNLKTNENGDLEPTNIFKFEFIKKLIDRHRKKLKMVEDHGDLIKVIYSSVLDEYDIHLVNIDHHHDIWYTEESKRDITRLVNIFPHQIPKISLESNWLGWLATNYNVVKIDEILNEDSTVDKTLLQYGVRFHFELGSPLKPYNMNILTEEFNHVIVATSLSYTSPATLEYVLNYLELTDVEVMKK